MTGESSHILVGVDVLGHCMSIAAIVLTAELGEQFPNSLWYGVTNEWFRVTQRITRDRYQQK